MRLGLLTDIHEQVTCLEEALRILDSRGMDEIIVLGDVFETGGNIDQTCQLLSAAGVRGVWGNHDFGLSSDPEPDILARYSPRVGEFMTRLEPCLRQGDCYFSHVEPWLNPRDVGDLWYFEGPPDSIEKVDRIFGAVPERWIFGGHYHRWLHVIPGGLTGWNGQAPLQLRDFDHSFVVVGALCEGQFAILDTDSGLLEPFHIDSPFAHRHHP